MLKVLPKPISDLSFETLEKCMDKTLDIDMSKFMTAVIDNLSENLLYYKAEQMSLTDGDGWANCTTEEEKRELIKQSFKQHKLKATVKCLKNLLTNEFLYTPWNEYDGIPNHYKLVIDLKNSDFSHEKLSKIIAVVESNKRLSAKQDNYDVMTSNTNPVFIASRFKTEITINPLPKEET